MQNAKLKVNEDRYCKFSQYLKERFGCYVYKVSIDAGFSCPNKDGKLSPDGCIYCDNSAFSFQTRAQANTPSSSRVNLKGGIGGERAIKPVEIQIEEGIKFGRERYGAEKFIVYFQAFTNTYAPLEILKEKYDVIRKFKNVIGLSIGTRPDCINEEILDLIKSYNSDYEVWLEYGLQSIHQKTLEFINRQHIYEDFLRAVELTRQRNLKVCAHIIIGLPEETTYEILETAKELGRLKLDGLKIHPLHIIKGTKLDDLFKRGLYKPLELAEYVDTVIEFLEYLWPETVIQRITADCPRDLLVAPLWILEKTQVLKEIGDRLQRENKFQGHLYKK